MKRPTHPFRALAILIFIYAFGNVAHISAFDTHLMPIESDPLTISQQKIIDASQVNPNEEIADEDETNFTILWCIGIFIVLEFLFAIYEVAPSGNRRKYNDAPF